MIKGNLKFVPLREAARLVLQTKPRGPRTNNQEETGDQGFQIIIQYDFGKCSQYKDVQDYSRVSNKRVGWNKRAGCKIF